MTRLHTCSKEPDQPKGEHKLVSCHFDKILCHANWPNVTEDPVAAWGGDGEPRDQKRKRHGAQGSSGTLHLFPVLVAVVVAWLCAPVSLTKPRPLCLSYASLKRRTAATEMLLVRD